jgi:hypothetical protein
VLHALTREAADAICVQRALSGEDKCRGFKAFRYGAKTWGLEPLLLRGPILPQTWLPSPSYSRQLGN